MDHALSTSSGLIVQASPPQWVLFIRELGIPTLIGVIAGGVINFFTTSLLDVLKNKKLAQQKKEDLAKRIIITIKSYQVIHGNHYGSLLAGAYAQEELKDIKKALLEARIKYNEMEAEAALYLPEYYEKLIEELKGIILSMAEEGEELMKKGVLKFTIYELSSGRKYVKKFKELKKHLRKLCE